MLEVTPHLDKNLKEPLYIQLFFHIKTEIRNGNIKTGEKLPSKRRLAQHLGISQNTVDNAYQQLYAEGYINSEPRRGMFVIYKEPNLFTYQSLRKSIEYTEPKFTKGINNNLSIDFNPGNIDVSHFPYKKWRVYSNESMSQEQSKLFSHGHPKGDILLREQIASYLYQARGVRASIDQIIIGTGNQYLIIMLLQLLSTHSNPSYGIEDPGFYRVRATLQKFNQSVTPSHQFPLGIIMPISRRLELLEWAYKSKDRFIIEDDYDGEFRYEGKPIPSLQGLDIQEKVIYLGTFSKSLIPSLRISYMVLPPSLIEMYEKNALFLSQTVSRFHQNTIYMFMKNGDWERHLNKMRVIYRNKRKLLLSSIEENFKKKVEVVGQNSGLHIILKINNCMIEQELIDSALSKGVKVYPCSIHYCGKDKIDSKLLLGFGGLNEYEIKHGIELLARSWL